MTARDFFRDTNGTVRAPWRLIIFGAAGVTAFFVVNGAMFPLLNAALVPTGVRVPTVPWGLLAAIVLAHVVTFRLVDPRGWRSVRLDRSSARPSAIAGAAVLGAGAIGLSTLPLLALGWLRVEPAPPGSWLVAGLASLVFLAPAALWEEMLFRGYAFAALAEWLGTPAALGVTSVAFGLVHLQNAGASPESISIVALAGLFLGAVLVVTRSLWAAFGAHLAWNWVLAGLLHSDVSGIPFATPDYRVVDAGPDWATGGSWGPEGGLLAALGLVSVMIYLYLRHRGREES